MREWALGFVPTQFWDFSHISLFPSIASLKSLRNLWDNSYKKFKILFPRLYVKMLNRSGQIVLPMVYGQVGLETQKFWGAANFYGFHILDCE